MSEFGYLAVFMSIIFGISTTHILAGVIRSIYRGQKKRSSTSPELRRPISHGFPSWRAGFSAHPVESA